MASQKRNVHFASGDLQRLAGSPPLQGEDIYLMLHTHTHTHTQDEPTL